MAQGFGSLLLVLMVFGFGVSALGWLAFGFLASSFTFGLSAQAQLTP